MLYTLKGDKPVEAKQALQGKVETFNDKDKVILVSEKELKNKKG